MINVGIIGGSGYTGGELIRILLQHPKANIDFIYSTTKAGQTIATAHPDLLGTSSLNFTSTINTNVDVVFLCLGHGNSFQFLEQNTFSQQTKIIDLSNDFRLKKSSNFGDKKFVYGLPELQKSKITSAQFIANPGCFATAIQLALLPLAHEKKLSAPVHVNAITGSTGAGVRLAATTHFSWRTNNTSWYKPFTHQHLDEINESLHSLQDNSGPLYFLPNRGNFTRGIFATAYTQFEGSLDEALSYYQEFYKDAQFTHISENPISLKEVVNTNKCHIHVHKHEDQLLLTSAIDNLLKGASGQAVQNMNLLFGFEEAMGLQLKASIF